MKWFKKEKEEEPKILSYKFKWRKEHSIFWESRMCFAHNYVEEKDRMVLYTTDGGIFEIPDWATKWSCLGEDWAEKARVQREQEKEMKEKDTETVN